MNKLAIILTSMVLGAMLAPPISQAMSEAGDRKERAEREFIQHHKDYVNGYYDNLDNEQILMTILSTRHPRNAKPLSTLMSFYEK